MTFSATPPLASVLTAQQVPAVGGDTLWSDLVGAYRALAAPVRALADSLTAVHHAVQTFDRLRDDDDGRQRVAELRPVRHPVVRVNPDSGARGLFVNPVFTSHIEDVSRIESEHLLALFYEQLARPEHVVRWRWRTGDVAIWDNRSTAHYATADYGERRVMHRVTVAGDRPFGPAEQQRLATA